MLEIIPDEKLVHSWEYPGYTGTSTVTWSLLKVDETTTNLTLTDDFNIPFNNKVEALKTGNFEKGWTHILTISLKEYQDKIQK